MLKRPRSMFENNHFVTREHQEAFYEGVTSHWEIEYKGDMDQMLRINSPYTKEQTAAMYIVASILDVKAMSRLMEEIKSTEELKGEEIIKELINPDLIKAMKEETDEEDMALLTFINGVIHEGVYTIPFSELSTTKKKTLLVALEILGASRDENFYLMYASHDILDAVVQEKAWQDFSKDKNIGTFLQKTNHDMMFENEDHFENLANIIKLYFTKDVMSNRMDNIPKNKLMYMYLISRFVYVEERNVAPYRQNSDGLESLDVRYGEQTKAYQKVLDFARAILKNRLDIHNIDKFYEDIEETDLAPDVYVAVKVVMGLITEPLSETPEITYLFSAIKTYFE